MAANGENQGHGSDSQHTAHLHPATPIHTGHSGRRSTGYTNQSDIEGIRELAWQFVSCLGSTEGRLWVNRFYYDLPTPIDGIMELAVHGAGGPSSGMEDGKIWLPHWCSQIAGLT